MQNVFIKQTVYDLSKIPEAELVISPKKSYNKDNTEVKNDENSEFLESS